MAKNLDLTLLPLYRLRGHELPSPPGLMALTPPRRPARGRDKDRLIVQLTLGGNAENSTVTYLQMTSATADVFYKTAGSVTSALRKAAASLNGDLLEQNMQLSGQGRYLIGNLILCALRGDQLFVLESGSTHVYWMADNERVHIHDEGLSGRGLGMGQATNTYLSQITIRAGGRLLLSPKLPPGWEHILQRNNHTAPLDIQRNALLRQSTEDENAVLVDVQEGHGSIEILKPQRQSQPTLEIITKKLKEEPTLADLPALEKKATQESHQPEPLPVRPVETKTEDAAEFEIPKPSYPSTRTPRRERDPKTDWTAALPAYVAEALEAGDAPIKKNLSPEKDEEAQVEASATEEKQNPLDSIPRQSVALPEKNTNSASGVDSGSMPKDASDLLASIPKKAPSADRQPVIGAAGGGLPTLEEVESDLEEIEVPSGPSTGEVIARKSARTIAKGMQATREGNQKIKAGFDKMLPRLLPSDEEEPVRMPDWVMSVIAIIIPVIVVTIATLVYFRFGRDMRYDNYFQQAEEARTVAISKEDPLAERKAWEDVLIALDLAEGRKITDETQLLRAEATGHIDSLLNILPLGFRPAINGLPRGISIKNIAVNDNEIFLLDENSGSVLRAYLAGDGYQYDDKFNCKAGTYAGNTVEELVEIQILPKANLMDASVLAFDNKGGLLYCAGNAIPQAFYLEQPGVAFKEVTAVTLQSNVLYVLDALSREVWVYGGQGSTFIQYPTAFFSTQAPEKMDTVIDLNINDTDLYLLFNDGHLATCTYSLLDSVPTRCVNPINLVDLNPAAGGGNNFNNAIFSNIQISEPPDAAILLMDASSQVIFRFSPRSYELLNQLKPSSNSEYALPAKPLKAMATNVNHILFIAQEDQVYMAIDAP